VPVAVDFLFYVYYVFICHIVNKDYRYSCKNYFFCKMTSHLFSFNVCESVHHGTNFRSTFEVGAVANLRNIKNAISVAHAVMKYTKHTLLVGSLGNCSYFIGFLRSLRVAC